MKKSP